MLEKLMRMYVCAMAHDVRGVVPHLVGPPGCGKSTTVQQLADMLDVKLHIVNVSRLSPLDVEGVQMPVTNSDGQMLLSMLPATFWTSLKKGDVLLLDEFLRAEYAAIYNALLDVLTSRRVGAYHLPKVFIVAASNSTIAYDQALEDRLLHILVADPRKSQMHRDHLRKLLVEQTGMLPSIQTSMQAEDLLDQQVLPMYSMLDQFTKSAGTKVAPAKEVVKGKSLRRLIGEIQLRDMTTPEVVALVDANNRAAIAEGKPQYVLLRQGHSIQGYTIEMAHKLLRSDKLHSLQRINTEINLGMLEAEVIKEEEGTQ